MSENAGTGTTRFQEPGRADAARPDTARLDAARLVWRFRLLTCCLVLAALAFLQAPGRIVADTKLDLAIAPGAFLGRAAHLWDAEGAFGQVQNQAYGYLFPMGPFFWVGDLLGTPPWVVQRLWWTLVLCVAFLGVVKLAGLLGIGTPVTRVVAGFAYALSPRMLTTLGPISIEAWPSALAPWVLAALVWGSLKGPPRTAAALAALGVAAVGGVNAAATAAVLPLGALWLLTRAPGPRRRSMMLWWPVFTFLATAWWLVPLFLLGRYSPPFLDFIEPAAVTTFPTTLFDALRGTSNWVPYIEPGWRAGNDLVTVPFLVLNSAVLLVLGVVGLARLDLPHRRFLLAGLVTGFVLVTFGHLGEVQGWFAAAQRDLLDAALAPLRNVHKFDPVIRLPLALALAHAVAVVGSTAAARVRAEGRGSRPAASVGVLVLAMVAVAGAAGPALAGRVAPAGSFNEIPAYWQQTADWLGERDDGTRALLVPGTSFGSYSWGEPRDEPLQALASAPWAVRNAIPLAPPGNIRMLDAVEDVLVSGRGSPGLAAYLARAGVGWVVVRNDLARGSGTVNPVRVRNAVASSPGLEFVASFGPLVGGRARLDAADEGPRVLVDGGWQTRYPAVEVYRVGGARAAAAGPVGAVVAGGPEDLLTLAELDALPPGPTTLALDASDEAGPPVVLTDGLRRRERNFGRVHDAASWVWTAEQRSDRDVPARDYLMPGQERWETVARWEGVEQVTASSSLADADAFGAVRTDRSPFAAFDGDERTSWVSGADSGAAWLQVDLEAAMVLSSVAVTAGDALGPDRQLVRVRTEQGVGEPVDLAPGERALVRFPEGPTRWVRVEGAAGTAGQRLALNSVEIPDVSVARPLVTPLLPEDWGAPDLVALSAEAGVRSGCVPVRLDTRCVPGLARLGDEPGGIDRVVTLSEAATYPVTASVRPRAGTELERLVQRGRLVSVEASSAGVDEPVASALATIDGDRGTTWVADVADEEPSLTVSWVRPRAVRGLRLALDRQAAATRPETVTLRYDGEEQEARVGGRGRVEVDPFRTDRLEIHLEAGEPARGLGTDGQLTEYGIGVSELRVRGAGSFPLPPSARPEVLPCGSGPVLVVNGQAVETSVTASRRELFLGESVPMLPCLPGESVSLVRGENRLILGASAAFTGAALLLGDPEAVSGGSGPTDTGSAPGVDLARPSAVDAELSGPGLDSPGVVRLGENRNDGWTAGAVEADGTTEPASPRVVDGWQQGWALPVAGGTLQASYAPDRWYRLALGGGAVLLLALATVAAVGLRRRVGGSAALPVAEEHPATGLALGAGGALALVLLGGWWGAGVGAVVAAALVLGGRRLPPGSWPWLVGAPVAAAALVAWWRPWGGEAGWAGELALPQVLVLVSLALLLGRDLPYLVRRRGSGSRRGRMSRSRMNGSSTVR